MQYKIIKTIISNDSNLKSFIENHRSDMISEVKDVLIVKLVYQLYTLENEFNCDLVIEGDLGTAEPSCLTFFFRNSPKNFHISFRFCGYYSNMFYLVNCSDEFVENCRDDVYKKLSKRLGNKPNESNWIWFNWFENELRNWDNSPKAWIAIQNGRLLNNFRSKIESILLSLDGYVDKM